MQDKDLDKYALMLDGEATPGEASGDSVHATVAAFARDAEFRHSLTRMQLARDVMREDYAPSSASSLLDTGFAARISRCIADEPAIIAPPGAVGDASAQAPQAQAPHGISAGVGEVAQGTVDSAETANVASFADHQAQRNPAESTAPVAPRQRLMAGFAIAATVAAVSVVGLNMVNSNSGLTDNGQQIAAITPAVGNVDGIAESSQVNSLQEIQQASALINSTRAGQPSLQLVSNSGTYWVSEGQKRNPAAEKKLNMFLSRHIEQSPTADVRGMLPYSRLAGYDPLVPSATAAENGEADAVER